MSISRTEQRGKLQDALDAAALYAARSTATDTPGISAVGTKALNANLQLIHGATPTASSFVLVPAARATTRWWLRRKVALPAFAPHGLHAQSGHREFRGDPSGQQSRSVPGARQLTGSMSGASRTSPI